ncbi:metal-dependent hydrolase [Pusillimonas caeni]|uniref:metal-dependent hydrolase n=1 Tax=Pusillimonas caeni TaxID=1348472 RepID=UPI000E59933D|nr:metal-dependent hydrolase [Pusillimonas caeni]TFL13542.1 metal-dependent hydrolase [Pusillimonas caeni]
MDSITQAALGAGICGAMLGRFHGRKAIVAGAVLATLPDLDVVIRYADPVSAMINHRGFSHSLFVLTVLSIALTAALRHWRPSPHYGAGRLFWAIWLTLITHPLLDAFTAYGTQLLWPLRPTPTAWSTLFIIDPFFTAPLTLAVIAALFAGPGERTRRAMRWTLAWCCVYLAASIAFKQVVENRVRNRLESNGVVVQAMFSTPQPFNILLWRVVARTPDGQYYESTTGILDRRPSEQLRLPLNTELARAMPPFEPLEGLRWFSGDWLRYDDIDGKLVVSDLRMGLGAGYYSFRFLFAHRASPGAPWQPRTPEFWPTRRGTSELSAVVRRVWQQTPPLPLATWAERMTQAPAGEANTQDE